MFEICSPFCTRHERHGQGLERLLEMDVFRSVLPVYAKTTPSGDHTHRLLLEVPKFRFDKDAKNGRQSLSMHVDKRLCISASCL